MLSAVLAQALGQGRGRPSGLCEKNSILLSPHTDSISVTTVILYRALLSDPWDGGGKKQMDTHKTCPLVHMITENLLQSDCPLVSMQKVCNVFTLCPLQQFHPCVSSPDLLVTTFQPCSFQVLDHLVKPSTTAHKLMQILTSGSLSVQSKQTAKDVLELRPRGRISLNTLRDTVLSGVVM